MEGDYLVELDEVKLMINRKRQKTFIISGKVLESTNPMRAPGCKPSQVMIIKDDIAETVYGNIKQFAGAILGLEDPDSYVPEEARHLVGRTDQASQEALAGAIDRFWDESLEYMINDAQPLRGTRIRLNCVQIETREKKPFTKHVWGPVVALPATQAA
jgi:hypothetical protein